MTVSFYNNSSAAECANKNLTLLGSYNAVDFNTAVSVDEPELLFDYDSSLINANYCQIAEYGRYYYVQEKTVLNGNQILLKCKSDGLMSFRSSIYASPCIAKRSTSAPNPEIEDPLINFKPIPKRIYRKMSQAFTPSANTGTYVLTVGGK